MSGSPPGMLTTGAPHSSTAFRHCSSVRCFLRIWAGYWILPHPAHVRLQRKSGSSISTNGYRSRRESFCLRTYAATVHIWESGTLIIHLPRGGGGGPPPPRSGKHIARANFTSRHGPSARERPEPEQNGGVQQEAGRQQQRLARPPRDGQVEDQDAVVEPRPAAGVPSLAHEPGKPADDRPAGDRPAEKVGERYPEVHASLGIVEDLPQEPPVSPDRHRIDHDVQEHHQQPRQDDDGGAPPPPPPTPP